MPDNSRLQLLGYIILCLIWSSTWLAIKVGLDAGTPTFFGASLRFLTAAVVLLPVAWRTRREAFRDRTALRLALITGVISFGVGYGLVYLGEQSIPSALCSLSFGFFPFWVAILSHFMIGDRLGAGKLIAIGMGLAGVALLYGGSVSELGAGAALGMTSVLVSVLIQGYANVLVKRDGRQVPVVFLNGVGMATGSGVLALAGLLHGEHHQHFPLTWEVAGAILYLGIFGSVVTFTIYYKLMKSLSATLMAFIALITPPLSVLLGHWVKGERLGPTTLLGGGIVLTGVILFNVAERFTPKPAAIPPPPLE